MRLRIRTFKIVKLKAKSANNSIKIFILFFKKKLTENRTSKIN